MAMLICVTSSVVHQLVVKYFQTHNKLREPSRWQHNRIYPQSPPDP